MGNLCAYNSQLLQASELAFTTVANSTYFVYNYNSQLVMASIYHLKISTYSTSLKIYNGFL